jgi:hypothetical protein
MLTKNIFGILILLFNAVGLGYCIYLGSLSLLNISSHKKTTPDDALVQKKNRPYIINDDIIPGEDDLLKDMDLSDLDNLNLDDFE